MSALVLTDVDARFDAMQARFDARFETLSAEVARKADAFHGMSR